MDGAVEARKLHKTFGETTALHSISLGIDSGEVFTLIGPNGAGKTTFVRLVTGTTSPSGGSVRLFGQPPAALDRERLSVLPQSFHPPGRLTGREIVRYYADLYTDGRPVETVLADVGMTATADQWYETLSGGQQRRVCLGAALVNDPDLLVLDEPTTGIDPGGRRRLWELLEGLRSAGTAILLTTHDMREASSVSDRVGLLDNGKLVAVGSPARLIDEHAAAGRVVVELAGDPAIDKLDLSTPAEWRNGELVISAVEPDQLGELVNRLQANDVEYTRLTWEQPDLEDVFLTVTEAEE